MTTTRGIRRLCAFLTAAMLAQASTADAAPISFTFTGTLADGGFFTGSMTYGSEDQDGRIDFGRYFALAWDVVVTGGLETEDAEFSSSFDQPERGRAQLETYGSTPFPAIGVIFLAPDPTEERGLSPHFNAPQGFDPDVQPTLADFGSLIPGSLDDPKFGIYRDGLGGEVLVSSMQIRAVPEPAALALAALGAAVVGLRRRAGARRR